MTQRRRVLPESFSATLVLGLLAAVSKWACAPSSGGLEAKSPQAQSAAKFAWPEGRRAAVSLTYDDALASQRTSAATQLDEFGLSGTFFLTGASEDLKAHRPEWRALLASGHELASHTMHHPCDRKFDWVPKGFATQDYDLPRMRAELNESRELLRQLGAPEPHTFAYPCGEREVGDGQSYVGLVAESFLAARGFASAVAEPATVVLSDVPTVDGALPADQLVALLDRAEEKGSWLVVTFHGVGADYLTVELEAHRALLKALAERRNQLWTAPFGEVAAHLAAHR